MAQSLVSLRAARLGAFAMCNEIAHGFLNSADPQKSAKMQVSVRKQKFVVVEHGTEPASAFRDR